MKKLLYTFLCSFISLNSWGQYAPELLTTPEKTHFKATSTSDDVVAFIKAVAAKSNLVHTETMFVSDSGNTVPLVVMARPKISSPQAAKESGKPVIYFQGNIHGGEVEGKEALMVLMRDMLFGDQQHLLDNQIVIFAPNYNPDGNNKMSVEHRKSQEHCPHLAGARRSGGDYDLNRDGIKMEAVETKGLMKNIILRWDPELFVDMHTTNGVWHGNDLTYAHSYHYAGQPATSDYTEQIMLPAITKTILDKYQLHLSIYGGYRLGQGWPPTKFYTYNHHPRYLVNQFSLRNKMAILSETFAHDKFYDRINAAHKFALEILEYTNSHGKQMQAINKASEKASIQNILDNAGKIKNGVRYQMVPTAKPMKLRTYDYLHYPDSSGKTKYVRTHNIIEIEGVENYSAFKATVEATVPRGYIIPASLKHVVEHLKAHGVVVEQLEKNQEFTGEEFKVSKLEISSRLFEHHNMVSLQGYFQGNKKAFKKGDYKVDLAQPLANLIFYMLEPQSDDGLVNWNFFDKALNDAGVNQKTVSFPVFKYW